MDKKTKLRTLLAGLLLVLGCIMIPADIHAAIPRFRTDMSTHITFPYIHSMSINGIDCKKPTKELLDKVDISSDPATFSYITKAYTAGKASKKSKKATAYIVNFKAPGTYTVNYKIYGYKYEYSFEKYADGKYVLNTYDTVRQKTSQSKKTASELFSKVMDSKGNVYYRNLAGNIYAKSPDTGVITKAKLSSSNVLVYSPNEYALDDITVKYVVTMGKSAVEEIVLGDSDFANYELVGAKMSSARMTYWKKTLTDTKGKLKVKMNTGYKIKNILVETFDKKGMPVIRQVKNNSIVTYSKYRSGDAVLNVRPETSVHVFYKDSIDDTYTRIKSLKKKSDGTYLIEYVTKNEDGTIKTGTASRPYEIGGLSEHVTFVKK